MLCEQEVSLYFNFNTVILHSDLQYVNILRFKASCLHET